MWKLAWVPPHCLVFGGSWAAEKRMTSALRTDKRWGRRAPRSPESLVSAVHAWLYSFLCTTSQEDLRWWIERGVERRNGAVPTFFQNFTGRMRLIKETLSVSKVTMQIVPDSIASRTLMQFEKVLEIDGGDGYTSLWIYLIPQNCTLKNG